MSVTRGPGKRAVRGALVIPSYEDFMFPLLEAVRDGTARRTRELIPELADALSVPPEERDSLLPSGGSTILYSRIQWAKTYMKHAGLLEFPTRGTLRITPKGQKAFKDAHGRIDRAFLRRYPDFVEFMRRSGVRIDVGGEATADASTPEQSAAPEELLELTIKQIRQSVAEELLERIAGTSPAFFEGLVVRLLVAMGYGGSYAEAARVVGQSGDGGIDGVINEDRLGLDRIYIQAKRWQRQRAVGRPDIQAFAGSPEGERAQKGVYITTSYFTRDAQAYVERIQKRIVLIDGPRMAELLIEHGVGVTTERSFTIPKVDLDFFEEE